jgi:hypothetical protein
MPKNTKKRKEKAADFTASAVQCFDCIPLKKHLLETKAETWEEASSSECRGYVLQGTQYVASRDIHIVFLLFDSHCIAYPKHYRREKR